LTRQEAARAIARARRRGERVVLTSGCFDLLHVGHVRSLEEARSLGDRLVVAINTDASVRRMKGPGRPILPARQRAELLAALACVDWVTTFGAATPRSTLGLLKPDVYAKGGDWPMETLVAQDLPPGFSGKVHRLRQVRGVRTTGIVEQIRGKRGGPGRRHRS
jgi:D-beta-D-heptose 7-phosphate kinase/D-beta-D-heptose 1-phosphate adenosyltransferase